MDQHGYRQYKEQSVNTMTQGELLLLLYDELLKRLVRAEFSLKQENYELFDQSVERCMDIVDYLKKTLSWDYEISMQLSKMYDFFIYELSRIKAKRTAEVITELKPLVEELRDAFRGAEKQVHY